MFGFFLGGGGYLFSLYISNPWTPNPLISGFANAAHFLIRKFPLHPGALLPSVFFDLLCSSLLIEPCCCMQYIVQKVYHSETHVLPISCMSLRYSMLCCVD
jgi:hypothetical protein